MCAVVLQSVGICTALTFCGGVWLYVCAVQEELGSYGIDLVNNRFLILQVTQLFDAALAVAFAVTDRWWWWGGRVKWKRLL